MIKCFSLNRTCPVKDGHEGEDEDGMVNRIKVSLNGLATLQGCCCDWARWNEGHRCITKVEVFRSGSNFTSPAGFAMGSRKFASSSSSNRLAGLVVTLHALYLIMDQVNGSELLEVRGPWGPLLGLMDGLASGRHGGAFRGDQGLHDRFIGGKNGYDIGKIYAGGEEYGAGGGVGGGWKDVDGRHRGHTAAGFSTSYRKDEKGDKSSYYDDGLGHHDKHKYGNIDQRFRESGGGGRRGGYHDSLLNKGSVWNKGKFGDWQNQGYGQGYGGYGHGGYGQGGYGHGGYGHGGYGQGGYGHGGYGPSYTGYGGYGWRRARFFTMPTL